MKNINLWLVQRCSMPKEFINPFGNNITELKDGAAQKALSKVISTDYMGAAEYEWGAFPKRLAKFWDLGSADDLGYFSIHLPQHFAVDRFYVVCHWEEIKEVQKALIELVKKSEKKDNYWPEVSKADHSSFRRVLLQEDGTTKDGYCGSDTKGWISMKHNIAWFVDEEMAKGFFHLMNGKKQDMDEDYLNAEMYRKWETINPLQQELAL